MRGLPKTRALNHDHLVGATYAGLFGAGAALGQQEQAKIEAATAASANFMDGLSLLNE
jgi:hypothetical protein